MSKVINCPRCNGTNLNCDLCHGEGQLASVPSWAGAMVSNWRRKANIPDDISDLEIFYHVECEQLCGSDSNVEETEDEIYFLRLLLDLEGL